MKKYISEIAEDSLSIEWEFESGGRLWQTYETEEEFREALNSADEIEHDYDDKEDTEDVYFRNAQTYSERHNITPDDEW